MRNNLHKDKIILNGNERIKNLNYLEDYKNELIKEINSLPIDYLKNKFKERKK